jgi:hypothetical protein
MRATAAASHAVLSVSQLAYEAILSVSQLVCKSMRATCTDCVHIYLFVAAATDAVAAATDAVATHI